jgi:CubicO group peptidase (beta-lactamase class C family)
LENRFGNPIEVLTDSLVFQQLGMTDTRQAWDESLDESRFARWYDTEGNQYENSCRTGASAADDLLTTVKDYCEFGIYVMNGGGLSPELFNRMVGPQSGLQKYRAQGLGWTVIRGLPGEEYLISHGGSDYGVKTLAYFLPESKRGIVMFTNGDNGFSVINNIILSTFDIGNDIYECMYYRPDLPEVTDVPQEILVKYTGTYRQPDGSVSTVALKENVLLVSGGRSPKTLYYPQAANMFFQREWDTQLEFVEDESGMITRMVIYHEGNKYAEAERIN